MQDIYKAGPRGRVNDTATKLIHIFDNYAFFHNENPSENISCRSYTHKTSQLNLIFLKTDS